MKKLISILLVLTMIFALTVSAAAAPAPKAVATPKTYANASEIKADAAKLSNIKLAVFLVDVGESHGITSWPQISAEANYPDIVGVYNASELSDVQKLKRANVMGGYFYSSGVLAYLPNTVRTEAQISDAVDRLVKIKGFTFGDVAVSVPAAQAQVPTSAPPQTNTAEVDFLSKDVILTAGPYGEKYGFTSRSSSSPSLDDRGQIFRRMTMAFSWPDIVGMAGNVYFGRSSNGENGTAKGWTFRAYGLGSNGEIVLNENGFVGNINEMLAVLDRQAKRLGAI